MTLPSVSLELQGTHVLITGGGGLIGSVVVSHFLAAGARVSSLDISYSTEVKTETALSDAGIKPKPHGHGHGHGHGHDDDGHGAHETATLTSETAFEVHCDVSDEHSVQAAFAAATERFGPIEACVALASLDLSVLKHASFVDASFSQLKRTLDVNIAGTWLTAREWLRGVKKAKGEGKKLKNVNLIIIGSESGHFGERRCVDYSLAKSAVQGGLLTSLRAEAPREWAGARVNAVAPGAVLTARWTEEIKQDPEQYYNEAQATTALGEPIPMEAVAKAILFLASQNFSSHVHGQVINVDGGKQGKLMWTKEEMAQ
ncbi:NAD(P)-binding protein [Pleomassaria siparia CBS 279.74]|uniref:NAD(P)-binding protein n=1 Tax=Pleomassaria siparia CBS 279.74 TaxID=1314801 RepID=A0A6G1JT48_9PLEO|nr:NAD(P)-binding protein [Pleomassaria siparia CBS 279.74]